MNLKIKKILAREFLIAITVLVIGILSFLFTYLYNWNKSIQVQEADEKIASQVQLADSISKSFREKTIEGKDYVSRAYFALKNMSDEYGIPYRFDYSEQAFRSKIIFDLSFRDSIYGVFKNKLDGFTKTTSQFDSSINSQLTEEDISRNNQSQKILANLKPIRIEKERDSSAILTFTEQVSFSLKIMAVAIFLFFVLRYAFYAINWSIKTMKQK